MKVCILVPSEEHMKQAGVRIRYRRIEDSLRALDHDLRVTPIQSFASREHFSDDVYIISKCYGAQAFLVTRLLVDSEKLIGVDLFDDYFSQTQDSRFTRRRLWLRTLLPSADFILCSTPTMRDLVESFASGLAVHVMNDPSPPLDAENIRAAALRKLEYAHRTRILHMGWFGVGDNRDWPVGLADLVAFGPDLARLRRRGFEVRLSILTNKRALTAQGLAMLRRLAVPYTVEEWTEERETALLAKSLACFLPVNGQNFSVVKSLNRAVSALTAGAQVLSTGYPLYEPLSPFIYRGPERLLDDLDRRTLAVREETAADLVKLMERWADAAGEARSLAEFLELCRKRKSAGPVMVPPEPLAAVIHGKDIDPDVHKFAQQMRILSVSSPFSPQKLNFDLRFSFTANGPGLQVYVAERYASLLGPNVRALLSPRRQILDTTYQKVDLSPFLPEFTGTALGRMNSPMSLAGSYAPVMASIAKVLEFLFPGIACYYSEQARMPWWIFPHDQTGLSRVA